MLESKAALAEALGEAVEAPQRKDEAIMDLRDWLDQLARLMQPVQSR